MLEALITIELAALLVGLYISKNYLSMSFKMLNHG